MHFTLRVLFSLLLLSLFSPILASPIDPSDSLPTRTTENSRDPSSTWGASGAAGSYYCVSPGDHPDWAGPIDHDDCISAYNELSNSVRDQRRVWILWSLRYRRIEPIGYSLQLPWGVTKGSCTLVMRIGREFGYGVLPYDDGGYFDARSWPTEGEASVQELLMPWRYDLIPRCAGDGKAGWESLVHQIGFALVLPSTSRIAQDWGPGILGGLNHTSLGPGLIGGFNHTSLGLVEVS